MAPDKEISMVVDPIDEVKRSRVNEIISSRPIPHQFSKQFIPLWRVLIIGIIVSCTNGYDYSQWNGLLNIPYFYENSSYPDKHSYFGLGPNNGGLVGTVNNMYWYGGLISAFFLPAFMDRLGRRGAMLSGAAMCIVGAILDGSATTLAQFMVGRFLLGFGMGIASSAAPTYVVEMAHPAHRGFMGGLYNAFWTVGSMFCEAVILGTINIQNDWSWRIPLITQMLPSVIVFSGGFFLPESPRWLVSKGKVEEARSIIAKYHCEGDISDPLVEAQIEEIEEALANDVTDIKSWKELIDYRPLFSNRSNRYRSFLIFIFGFILQFNGGAMGNYSTLFNRLAGINDSFTQQALTFGGSCWSFVMSGSGSTTVDRFGRRTNLLIFICTWYLVIGIQGSLLTAFQATQVVDADGNATDGNRAISIAWIVMGYVGSTFWTFFFTPLQALLPVELWGFNERARGLAFNSILQNIASITNNYLIPVFYSSLKEKLNWFYLAWGVVAFVMVFFFWPETKGRSLEDLDEIFAAKNPVKAARIGQFSRTAPSTEKA